MREHIADESVDLPVLSGSTRYYIFLLALVLACASFYGSTKLTGLPFWMAFTMSLLVGLAVVMAVVRRGAKSARPILGRVAAVCSRGLQNVTLAAASVMVIVISLEGFLLGYEAFLGRQDAQALRVSPDYALLQPATLSADALERIWDRRGVVSLPSAWARKSVNVQGSHYSYRWHGVLHVHSEDHFRRVDPFPEKRDDVYRIVVVGDSLTYGYGIEERFTYSSIVEAQLSTDHAVEVLNLGVSGYQSEDVLNALERFLPDLDPDLVIYGVCLNDFLPTRIGQYQSTAYALPLPEAVKTFFGSRSRLARLLIQRYDSMLISLGLRPDFMDDILKDFAGYKTRFGRDVVAMAALVRELDMGPMVALVLDQFPVLDGRSHRVALVAESLLLEAGVNVVSTSEYYRLLDGEQLQVSRWEGHPNEIANALFASLLLEEIRDYPGLLKYRRPTVR